MTVLDSTHQYRADLSERLRAARDSARIQLHLLSLDAQARWRELEERLELLQAQLTRGLGLSAGAAHLRELGEAVNAILSEIQGTFELATPVRNFMKSAPSACSPDDPLSRAAQIMWETDAGIVPVVASDGRVLGVLTDRDLCMATFTRERTLSTITVSSAMSLDVCTASPDDTLGHVFYLMGKRRVRRLPVVEAGRLVGMVSLADIALHIQRYPSNSLPACVALSHMLASISERRPSSSNVAA